jgi:hypothetical protein
LRISPRDASSNASGEPIGFGHGVASVANGAAPEGLAEAAARNSKTPPTSRADERAVGLFIARRSRWQVISPP